MTTVKAKLLDAPNKEQIRRLLDSEPRELGLRAFVNPDNALACVSFSLINTAKLPDCYQFDQDRFIQETVMTVENGIDKDKLVKELTPEFLQTLHDAATFVGWDLDAIEVGKFVEKLYTMAGQSDKFKQLDL